MRERTGMARLPLRFLLTRPPLTVGKVLNRHDIAKSRDPAPTGVYFLQPFKRSTQGLLIAPCISPNPDTCSAIATAKRELPRKQFVTNFSSFGALD
jgi:hypothetical protein